jgi:hypothetical protein
MNKCLLKFISWRERAGGSLQTTLQSPRRSVGRGIGSPFTASCIPTLERGNEEESLPHHPRPSSTLETVGKVGEEMPAPSFPCSCVGLSDTLD